MKRAEARALVSKIRKMPLLRDVSEAARQLAAGESAEAVKALRGLLDDRSAAIREEALAACACLTDPDADIRQAAVDPLGSEDDSIRRAVVNTLGYALPEEDLVRAAPALRALIEREPNPGIRADAAKVLAGGNAEEVVSSLDARVDSAGESHD